MTLNERHKELNLINIVVAALFTSRLRVYRININIHLICTQILSLIPHCLKCKVDQNNGKDMKNNYS